MTNANTDLYQIHEFTRPKGFATHEVHSNGEYRDDWKGIQKLRKIYGNISITYYIFH